MHIGFVGNVPPPVGGAEVFLQGFLDRFLDSGHNRATLVRWARQVSAAAGTNEVLQYAAIGEERTDGGLTTHYLFDSLHGDSAPRRSAKKFAAMYRDHGEQATQIFRSSQVELIHAHSLGNLPFAAFAAHELGIPLIVTVHGMLEFRLLEARPGRWAEVADAGLKHADLVLAVSEEIVEHCRSKAIRNVRKLSCGIDTSFFQACSNEQSLGDHLLFVGSVRNDKGAPLLIDAYQRLRGTVDCDLVFVGKRHINGEVIAAAERNPRIRFAGQRDAEGVRRALQDARIVILPSESEGLPLSILEAMSCQRPVLVSATGELSNIIRDGQNGFLIRDRTAEELAGQITELLHHPDLSAIGRQARQTALEFDLDHVVDRHQAIYQSILG